jgi:endonuclease III
VHCSFIRVIDKPSPCRLGDADDRRDILSVEKILVMAKSRRSESDRRAHAGRVVEALKREYPETACALVHDDPYQLLVATILSAQCTDARVNLVTPELFRRFPDASRLANAVPSELEALIRSTGFFRAKARNLLAMANQVAERHGGRIPEDLESLTALGGVGRKTANVVLGTAFGIAEGVVVDTHVKRLARRLGLTTGKTPEQIERDLMRLIPRHEWVDLSHRLIQHGRRICLARRPKCEACSLADLCPKVGVIARPAAAGSISSTRKGPKGKAAGASS